MTVCQKVPKLYFKSQFWMSKINQIFSKNQSMNYGSSKSAKMVPSKSIFDVKNQVNFFKKKLGLGQIFCPKD